MENCHRGIQKKRGYQLTRQLSTDLVAADCIQDIIQFALGKTKIREGGAQSKIWSTQYGFRQQVGTTEALFIARRCVEKAWSEKDGKTILLALDWAKAFDSVSPDALLGALTRFGIPQKFIGIIGDIYVGRKFYVREAG